MNVLFTSDLHGQIPLFEQLLGWVRTSCVEHVVLGGDFLPALLQPGGYEEMIPRQRSFIRGFLIEFFKKCLESTVRRIYLIPGNWDTAYPFVFDEPVEGVVNLDRKMDFLAEGIPIIGYPFVPPTPFRPKDYEKMDDLGSPWPPQKSPAYIRSPESPSRLIPIDPQVYLHQTGTIQEDLPGLPVPADYKKSIYVMHSPPHGTRLDVVHSGTSVGSRAMRTFIEARQPLLTLHGHIHESPVLSGSFLDRIGETLAANPGQELGREGKPGELHALIFDPEKIEPTLLHTRWQRPKGFWIAEHDSSSPPSLE
jgi:Icc-related predicted phosphoesterase